MMRRAVCSIISGEYFKLLLCAVCVCSQLYAHGSRDHCCLLDEVHSNDVRAGALRQATVCRPRELRPKHPLDGCRTCSKELPAAARGTEDSQNATARARRAARPSDSSDAEDDKNPWYAQPVYESPSVPQVDPPVLRIPKHTKNCVLGVVERASRQSSSRRSNIVDTISLHDFGH